MDLVVFCTHEYEYMIPPHAALLARYAPGMKMLYYGDRQVKDLPDNVEFRRAPHLGAGASWSWAPDDQHDYGGFGKGFAACIEEMGEPVVLFTFPDMWPASPIHRDRLDDLAGYVRDRPKVMRVQVAGEVGCASMHAGYIHERWRGLEMATISARDNHHGHMGGFHWFPSLWNVPLLMDFFIPGCSHWGFESLHQRKMHNRPDLMSCWPRRPAYQLYHVHLRREPGLLLHDLAPDDRDLVKSVLRPGTWYYENERTGWQEA